MATLAFCKYVCTTCEVGWEKNAGYETKQKAFGITHTIFDDYRCWKCGKTEFVVTNYGVSNQWNRRVHPRNASEA